MDHSPRMQAALRRFMDRGTLVWPTWLDQELDQESWSPRRVFDYPPETEIPGMLALSRAVARALAVIAAEKPTPSTEALFQSAFGHWREGPAHGYEKTMRVAWEQELRRFPSPLFRAILVAHCPERSELLDAQACALIKQTFWLWTKPFTFEEARQIYLDRWEEAGWDSDYDGSGYSYPPGLTVIHAPSGKSRFGRECSAHGLRYCGHCQWPRQKTPRTILEARYVELATAADWEPEILMQPFGRGRLPAAAQARYAALVEVVAQLRKEGHTLEEIGSVTGRDRTAIHRFLEAAH